MPNNNYNRWGPWVSFPKPVPAPQAEITDEPLLSLCANAEWVAYVLGASKVLTQFQTWEEDDPDVLATITGKAIDLLSSWAEGCAAGPDSNFFFYSTLTGCYNMMEWAIPRDPEINFVANFVEWNQVVINASIPVEPMTVEIKAYASPGGQNVGVPVKSIRICPMSPDTAVHIFIIDCLDQEFTLDTFGPVVWGDIFPEDTVKDLKSISVTVVDLTMVISVLGQGSWVCGPA